MRTSPARSHSRLRAQVHRADSAAAGSPVAVVAAAGAAAGEVFALVRASRAPRYQPPIASRVCPGRGMTRGGIAMSPAAMVLTEKDQAERDALLGRLYNATIGALELFHVYLGERLGLYETLGSKGALTAAELAATAGIKARD